MTFFIIVKRQLKLLSDAIIFAYSSLVLFFDVDYVSMSPALHPGLSIPHEPPLASTLFTMSTTDLRERFLPYTPSCFHQDFTGSWQFNGKGSRASCCAYSDCLFESHNNQ